MLGFFSIISSGSRDKIGYGKRKLAEICDAAYVIATQMSTGHIVVVSSVW